MNLEIFESPPGIVEYSCQTEGLFLKRLKVIAAGLPQSSLVTLQLFNIENGFSRDLLTTRSTSDALARFNCHNLLQREIIPQDTLALRVVSKKAFSELEAEAHEDEIEDIFTVRPVLYPDLLYLKWMISHPLWLFDSRYWAA